MSPAYKHSWALGFLFLLVGCGQVVAQNPNGFIQADQWACLLPLQANDCTGGGAHTMLENWVAPHIIRQENPVVGTVWSDIDFGGTAHSLEYRGVGQPQFVALDLGPDPDVVDFESYLDSRGLVDDFILAIAVTYVENLTGAPLPVNVCLASDDSIQVWLNTGLIANTSTCRGLFTDCIERPVAVLEPGVNRLTALVWDGIGDFAFRLALTTPDGQKITTTGNPLVRILGATTDLKGPNLPVLTRRVLDTDYFCPSPSHVVTLSGASFDTRTSYLVCEELRATAMSPANVFDISSGGTTSLLFPTPLIPPPMPPGIDFSNHRVVGADRGEESGTTQTILPREYQSTSSTGGDIWEGGDSFEFAYNRIEGDFDVSVCILSRKHSTGQGRWGKFGLMARETLETCSRFTMIQDHLPDLQDAARVAGRRFHLACQSGGLFEAPIAGTVPHPLCFRLTRRGTVIQGWHAHTQAMMDGRLDPRDDANWTQDHAEDWGQNAPQRLLVGFANSEHHSSGVATQTVRFRALVLDGERLEPPFETDPVGVKITWQVPGNLLGNGVHYSVQRPPGTSLLVTGRAGTAETDGPRALYFQDLPTGPLGVFQNSHNIGRGGPCAPGSISLNTNGTADPTDDVYTTLGGGTTIGNGGDQFHFVYEVLEGDFTVEARFSDFDLATGKFGLMARWDCSPESAYFFTFNQAAKDLTCGRPGPRIGLRHKTGGQGGVEEPNFIWWQDVFGVEPLAASCNPVSVDPRVQVEGDSRNLAPWLRLVRRGNSFYGYASRDGSPGSWRALGSFAWYEPPRTMLVGVASSSELGCEAQVISWDRYSRGFPSPIVPKYVEGEVVKPLGRFDFDADLEGDCPVGWTCTSSSATFKPKVVENRLRITNLRNDPQGSGQNAATAAYWNRPLDLRGFFLLEFDVFARYNAHQAGDGPGGAPGHGLTLFLMGIDRAQKDNPGLLDFRRGDAADGLGFAKINQSRDESVLRTADASRNSIAVEIDLRHTSEVVNDGDGVNVSGWDPIAGPLGTGTGPYHVAVDANATVHSLQRNLQFGVPDDRLPDVFDPEGIHVQVLYDHGHVRAWLRPNRGGGGGGGIGPPGGTPVLDIETEPVEENASEGYVGFSGGTGEETVILEIDELNVGGGGIADIGDFILFYRADANGDRETDLSDAVTVFGWLYLGTRALPCHAAADANDDNKVDVSDGIFILNYLFLGNSTPPSPGPVEGQTGCGRDPIPPVEGPFPCDSYPC